MAGDGGQTSVWAPAGSAPARASIKVTMGRGVMGLVAIIEGAASTFGLRGRTQRQEEKGRKGAPIMKNRILIAAGAIALAAILASVPFAFAQHSMMRHGDGFGSGMMFGHLGHLKSDLGLSDDQATQIKTIFKSLHDQNAAHRVRVRGGMQQVARALL